MSSTSDQASTSAIEKSLPSRVRSPVKAVTFELESAAIMVCRKLE